MAVANVAWILAGQGQRVLVIDWDLEAPGLHRYFHPFIEDKELSSSPGVIDFFVDFVEGTRVSHRDEGQSKDARWFESYTNLLPYAFSLDWEFEGDGTLDFVPAGQQGPGYGVRVTRFDWDSFYGELGGGVFLETMKEQLRGEYDYILIDSRTGISDTSGICTVQMPDDLVVCFTLNNQSIQGAAAVAESAFTQRRKPTGEPGLRVWPVPTRVELAEKDRLEAARDTAQRMFQQYLLHLPRVARRAYWGGIEVPYDPYFAYEEVLANFAERRHSKLSVLDSMLTLTRYITDGKVTESTIIPEALRREILKKFSRSVGPTAPEAARKGGYFYLSYANEDARVAEFLGETLNMEIQLLSADPDRRVVWDRKVVRPGDVWLDVLQDTVSSALGILVLVTPNWMERAANGFAVQEVISALEKNLRVIPLLMDTFWRDLAELPPPLNRLSVISGLELPRNLGSESTRVSPEDRLEFFNLAQQLENVALAQSVLQTVEVDSEDPQKGLWGGRSLRNGRALRAEIKALSSDWFEITLEVSHESGPPLKGGVEFHLHPTFESAVRRIDVKKGKARLVLSAWGAFTVGAIADDGKTRLELDLSKLSKAPRIFRQR